MSTSTQPGTRHIEGILPDRTVLGVTLAAIGAIVLTGFAIPEIERYSLLAISAVLLGAFALTREYGFAIPAAITGGLGTMTFLVTGNALDPSAVAPVVLFSVAGGFAAIWPLGFAALPRTVHPWPLVPATTLGLIGLASAAQQPMALGWIQAALALVLVVAGGSMVLRRQGR